MSINIEQKHNVNCVPLDKPLPCPFCGSEPGMAEKESSFRIYCENGRCVAIGDCELCYCWIEEANKRRAIKRWNTRLILFVSATEYIERELGKGIYE